MKPMCAWPLRARWAALAVAVALGAGATLAIVPIESVFHSSDSSHYLQIAAGRTDEVMQPFASRQLGALVAAWLARLLHGDLHAGFLVQAAVSLLFALGVTCWLALRTSAPRWLLLALVLTPCWTMFVQYLVLPDLWYAGLMAGLLLLLAREQYLAAALMMFPLMLSRESTSLTLLCFLLAAWGHLAAQQRWRVVVTAVVSAAAGSLIVGRLAAGSRPNVEHLPEAVYIFAKLPWNFLRNVVGVLPWSDANPELCTVPVWSTPFHWGPVHALGICGFSVLQQLITVQVTLTHFGLLPLLLGFLWWRHRRWQGRSVLLRFALLYGGASLLLAPLLGAGFMHLMQYAWPLFLVALPQLLDEFPMPPLSAGRAAASVGFFALHLAACGVSYWPVFLPMIWVGLTLWVAGFLLLKLWFGGASNPLAPTPDSPLSEGPAGTGIHSANVVKSA